MASSLLVQEVHKIREEYAQRYGNDLKAICEAARVKQANSGHQVVHLPPKPIATAQVGVE